MQTTCLHVHTSMLDASHWYLTKARAVASGGTMDSKPSESAIQELKRA